MRVFLRIIIHVLDRALYFFPKRQRFTRVATILLSNPAHIGDVVLGTSVLPAIKKKFPKCKIGFLVGSWSKGVLQDHPLVDYVHVVDHFYLNRQNVSLWKKLLQYLRTRRTALKEIRAIGYDVAIDLYFYIPPSIWLFYKAGIPVRIGYARYGARPLYTHPFSWDYKAQPIPYYYQPLLKSLGITSKELKCILPAGKPVKQLPSSYILFHMGVGNPIRKWPLLHWRELRQLMEEDGFQLVFTGKGQEEKGEIEEVASAKSINLCNRLSFAEWMSVIAKARLVIGVESSAGHIAAAMDTPCIFIHSGTTCQQMWKPFSNKAISVRADVSCAPCFLKDGCSHMSCIRNISPANVYQKAKWLLTGSSP